MLLLVLGILSNAFPFGRWLALASLARLLLLLLVAELFHEKFVVHETPQHLLFGAGNTDACLAAQLDELNTGTKAVLESGQGVRPHASICPF